jgi:hypothetical protein
MEYLKERNEFENWKANYFKRNFKFRENNTAARASR